MYKPTVGSLFAGIGGLDLGLERAGFKTKWQVEIDDYARMVLQRHFPDAERFRDVRQFPPKPDSAWLLHRWRERFSVDLICGGFPCQDISYAGKGAGLEGERSGLFYEIIRIVRILGPRFVLLENVSALLTRGLDQVLGTLASIGYDAEWHCIPAASVGAPHIRDRVFILAYSNSYGFSRRAESYQWQKQSAKQTSQRDYSLRLGLRGRWAAEPNVGRVVDGVSEVLDSRGRISTQPTPKDKAASRIHRLRGLGNAVVPQVAEFIGHQIMQSI